MIETAQGIERGKRETRPEPSVGMTVGWIRPTNGRDERFISQMIKKYGMDGLSIAEIQKIERKKHLPKIKYLVMLKKNETLITEGENQTPIWFAWSHLWPMSRKKQKRATA